MIREAASPAAAAASALALGAVLSQDTRARAAVWRALDTASHAAAYYLLRAGALAHRRYAEAKMDAAQHGSAR